MISSRRPLFLLHRLHANVRYYAADKQLLSRLRKSTGFTFVKCREALEKFDNDLKQAEAWLRERAQEEGWAKAAKLQSRAMSQGLVGVAMQDTSAAIVEVNCETDFVARNVKFQNFVSVIANACLQYGSAREGNKIILDKNIIRSIEVDNKSVADLTALEIGNVGENLAARRAVYLSLANGQQRLASYVHATGPQSSTHGNCTLGKYGALVLYEGTCTSMSSPAAEGAVSLDEIGRRLCQHIVGMNPQSIGSLDDEKPPGSPEDETRLIFQEYMLDTTVTVRDVLQQSGASVLDFVRLECGETLPEDSE